MEQMTVTAKIQIAVTPDSKVLLDETMSVYSDACNYVSDYVFRTHDLKQFSLNKVLYSTLREKGRCQPSHDATPRKLHRQNVGVIATNYRGVASHVPLGAW